MTLRTVGLLSLYLAVAGGLTFLAIYSMQYPTKGWTWGTRLGSLDPNAPDPNTYTTTIYYGYPIPVEIWRHQSNAYWFQDEWRREGTNYVLPICILLGAWALPIVAWDFLWLKFRRSRHNSRFFQLCLLVMGVALGGIFTAAGLTLTNGWGEDLWSRYYCSIPMNEKFRPPYGFPAYTWITAFGMGWGLLIGVVVARRRRRTNIIP